jgi:hypothetical protein
LVVASVLPTSHDLQKVRLGAVLAQSFTDVLGVVPRGRRYQSRIGYERLKSPIALVKDRCPVISLAFSRGLCPRCVLCAMEIRADSCLLQHPRRAHQRFTVFAVSLDQSERILPRDAGRFGNVLGLISKIGGPIAVALILCNLVVGHLRRSLAGVAAAYQRG